MGTPPPGWGGRYWIFVKLTADNGIAGYGEVYAASVGPEAMKAVIGDLFARHMEGENPENIELMFRRAYSSGFTQRPDLTVMGAFSGLEMACWDILGKAHERPVYALLGGLMNERIRSYTYLYPLPHHDISKFWLSPEMAAESAAEMVKLGFTAVKFDPAGSLHAARRPSAGAERHRGLGAVLRDACAMRWGPRPTCCSAPMASSTPPAPFAWASAWRNSTRCGSRSRFRRTTCWNSPRWPGTFISPSPPASALTTKAEFGTLLRTGGASILQPALGRSGGILETKKIAAMAEAFNAQMAPHLYAGPVEWAANIQLAANIPEPA